jgi:hypothetical protein
MTHIILPLTMSAQLSLALRPNDPIDALRADVKRARLHLLLALKDDGVVINEEQSEVTFKAVCRAGDAFYAAERALHWAENPGGVHKVTHRVVYHDLPVAKYSESRAMEMMR